MVNATCDIAVEPIEIPSDEEALARGEHVAIVRGCTDCHTSNLAGGVIIDELVLGQINYHRP